MHIAIAGNIGSGKTTLTRLLSQHFKWTPMFEKVEDNSYLNDFYKDMQRWSFNIQIFFLNRRFKNIIDIKRSKETIVQDRTIYEDACIFAVNLHKMGLMSSRDFENYISLFNLMMDLVAPPDLLIYLKASIPTLVAQIQERGREYETGIRIDYLTHLNTLYEEWIDSYKERKLIIDVDKINFAKRSEDLNIVIDRINAELYGLF
ncbi:MAG: deoxynucleoside kinase [Prevotellaceae bacterium]|jgi:deoxyadenosine/deoxycytidine kinase|nr:deoxynucleoside kinase [Prevotellaceae bacterium]